MFLDAASIALTLAMRSCTERCMGSLWLPAQTRHADGGYRSAPQTRRWDGLAGDAAALQRQSGPTGGGEMGALRESQPPGEGGCHFT